MVSRLLLETGDRLVLEDTIADLLLLEADRELGADITLAGFTAAASLETVGKAFLDAAVQMPAMGAPTVLDVLFLRQISAAVQLRAFTSATALELYRNLGIDAPVAMAPFTARADLSLYAVGGYPEYVETVPHPALAGGVDLARGPDELIAVAGVEGREIAFLHYRDPVRFYVAGSRAVPGRPLALASTPDRLYAIVEQTESTTGVPMLYVWPQTQIAVDPELILPLTRGIQPRFLWAADSGPFVATTVPFIVITGEDGAVEIRDAADPSVILASQGTGVYRPRVVAVQEVTAGAEWVIVVMSETGARGATLRFRKMVLSVLTIDRRIVAAVTLGPFTAAAELVHAAGTYLFMAGDGVGIQNSEAGGVFAEALSVGDYALCAVTGGQVIVGGATFDAEARFTPNMGGAWGTPSANVLGFTEAGGMQSRATVLGFCDLNGGWLVALWNQFSGANAGDVVLRYSGDLGATIAGELQGSDTPVSSGLTSELNITACVNDNNDGVVFVGSYYSEGVLGSYSEIGRFNVYSKAWEQLPIVGLDLDVVYRQLAVYTDVAFTRGGSLMFLLGFEDWAGWGASGIYRLHLVRGSYPTTSEGTWVDLTANMEAVIPSKYVNAVSGYPDATTDAIHFANSILLATIRAEDQGTGAWDTLLLRSYDSGTTWELVVTNALPAYDFVTDGGNFLNTDRTKLHQFANADSATWVYTARAISPATPGHFSIDNGDTFNVVVSEGSRGLHAVISANQLPH